ncbi:MAG: phosphoribosylanthranilate isomerase [Clostridiales bacterium]|nr:phosphoribosylanthranilate isomerase [Clostridiales bacterium]
MAKIKICGLRRERDIDFVNELKPDYIGFILTDGFRRSITMQTAAKLKKRLDPNIKAVGVFVNDDICRINEFVEKNIIDIVQLHGDESPLYCEKITAPVIKVFKPENFSRVNEYNPDFYLFDSGTGTGKTFDWSAVPNVKKPFFIAGGLDFQNIPTAIKKLSPYCIDVSSSVESGGYKDYNKIKQVMECIKNE